MKKILLAAAAIVLLAVSRSYAQPPQGMGPRPQSQEQPRPLGPAPENETKTQVEEFLYCGPYSLSEPFMVDSTDVNGKSFNAGDVLGNLDTDGVWKNGTVVAQLPAGSADTPQMHLAAFVMENTAYTEASVQVEGIGKYKLYVDGKEQGAGRMSLTPASHKLVIEYLTGAEGKSEGADPAEDTQDGAPKVTISGEKLSFKTSGGRLYTLDDVLHGTRIAGTSISPDGKYLITSYRTGKADGTSDQLTILTEISTGRVIAETRDRLEWMPRSVKYYFTRSAVHGKQLVVRDPATGAEEVLSENLPEGRFFFSPTEDFLLYSLREDGPREREDVYEVIHPDDRQPGWRSRSYLAKYDLSTGLMQRLTFGYRNVWGTDISNDGRYVLMTVQSYNLLQRPTTLMTVYRLDLETLEAEEIVAADGFIHASAFSPDGSRVLVGGGPEAFGGVGMKVNEGQTPNEYDGQLFLVDVSSKGVTPLTVDFDPAVTDFQWSKADGNIYFTAEDRDCVHLFRLDGKSLEISLLDVGEELVKDFSLAEGAQALAVYGESAANCERLYCLNTKTLRTTLLRDLHAEQMSGIEFGQVLPWDYTNSRGDVICGRYYLPPHFDPDKKYPMIVNYYGGCSPTSRNFEGRYPHHAYAALGYVVYIVEPSGATGFGQEFSARHVNTAGDYVADDIIEGVKKFCQEHSFVDSSKVGCIGASYGGFMTQYLQTRTDIFAAAISHAGISDHTSYWGEGYWGYSYSEVSMAGSYPWSESDLYVSHSPLYNADKIHTPILFLHGDADHNVPVGESIQMYTALKLLGRETAMVLVKDQDHHILDYTKRIRWQATIFAWFAKYLQDDSSWWESMYPGKEL